MVFKTGEVVPPEFARAKMSIVELVGKVHVYSLNIFGEDRRTRAKSYCK